MDPRQSPIRVTVVDSQVTEELAESGTRPNRFREQSARLW